MAVGRGKALGSSLIMVSDFKSHNSKGLSLKASTKNCLKIIIENYNRFNGEIKPKLTDIFDSAQLLDGQTLIKIVCVY